MALPCLPPILVHHSAATLKAWASWLAAHAGWIPVAACVAVSSDLPAKPPQASTVRIALAQASPATGSDRFGAGAYGLDPSAQPFPAKSQGDLRGFPRARDLLQPSAVTFLLSGLAPLPAQAAPSGPALFWAPAPASGPLAVTGPSLTPVPEPWSVALLAAGLALLLTTRRAAVARRVGDSETKSFARGSPPE